MTKAVYYEMCEALGNEPVESEIPLDLTDFPPIVQQCFTFYSTLPDNWDTMGGNFMGKDYSIVFKLFNLYAIEQEEQLLCLDILQAMDAARSKIVADKNKAAKPKSPST